MINWAHKITLKIELFAEIMVENIKTAAFFYPNNSILGRNSPLYCVFRDIFREI